MCVIFFPAWEPDEPRAHIFSAPADKWRRPHIQTQFPASHEHVLPFWLFEGIWFASDLDQTVKLGWSDIDEYCDAALPFSALTSKFTVEL